MSLTEMEIPKMRIPKHLHFRALVDCQAHLTNTRDLILNKLTEAQLRMFRAHPLGRLIDIQFQFSGPLVLYILLRQIEPSEPRSAQFFVGGEVMSFTFADFVRITELPEPVNGVVMGDPSNRLMRLFLNGEHGLQKKELELRFRQCRAAEHTDEDMVKFALVVFIELVLLGTSKARTIDYTHFDILDDPATAATFPWAKTIWLKLVEGINSAISKQKLQRLEKRRLKGEKDKKTNETGPSLVGFAHVFQAWIYEKIPKLAELRFVERIETLLPLHSWRKGVRPSSQDGLKKVIFDHLDKMNDAALEEQGVPCADTGGDEFPSTSAAPNYIPVDSETDGMRSKMNEMEENVRRMEQRMEENDRRMEQRMEENDRRMEQRMEEVRNDIRQFKEEVKEEFRRMLEEARMTTTFDYGAGTTNEDLMDPTGWRYGKWCQRMGVLGSSAARHQSLFDHGYILLDRMAEDFKRMELQIYKEQRSVPSQDTQQQSGNENDLMNRVAGIKRKNPVGRPRGGGRLKSPLEKVNKGKNKLRQLPVTQESRTFGAEEAYYPQPGEPYSYYTWESNDFGVEGSNSQNILDMDQPPSTFQGSQSSVHFGPRP